MPRKLQVLGILMAQEDTKEAVWRSVVELLTCCWSQTEYETPPEQPSQPPVQTLAESLIPTGGAAGLSATPSVDEEAMLLPVRNQPGMPSGEPAQANGHSGRPGRDHKGQWQHAHKREEGARASAPARGRLKGGLDRQQRKSSGPENPGIELKEAAANPLLGQYHIHDSQGFVKARPHSGQLRNGAVPAVQSAQ
ncbi:hypothetical protein WJX73_006530 [Symbiochloris irregularis]|uniref:Uncharacterized protein n=1 Tax=Symbiochloris irregularis TaxID=706552 RepID=A0AAW1P5H4_9CHLO